MPIDRHYEDMDENKLMEAHNFLYKSIVNYFGWLKNDTRKDELNLLLEYERELAFREQGRR